MTHYFSWPCPSRFQYCRATWLVILKLKIRKCSSCETSGKSARAFLIVLVRASWMTGCQLCASILEQRSTVFNLVSCDSVLHVSPIINFLAWFNSIKLSIVTTTVSLSVLYQSLLSTENCVTDFRRKDNSKHLLILLENGQKEISSPWNSVTAEILLGGDKKLAIRKKTSNLTYHTKSPRRKVF